MKLLKLFKKNTNISIAIFTLLIIISILSATFIPNHKVTKIYISNSGNDTNSGSYIKPIKSFNKAISLISELMSNKSYKNDIEIIIRGGTYYLSDSINLDFSNNKRSDIKIKFKPYKNETVYINGGYKLDTKNFYKLTDKNIINSLTNPSAADNIYVYSLDCINLNYNYSKNNINSAPQIYFNEEPLTLSRYPNDGFMTINKIISNKDKNYVATFKDSKININNNYTNAYINGYLYFDWDYTSTKIDSLNNNTITLNSSLQYGIRQNRRFYISNVLEELDTPGEYYIDYSNSLLYIIPPFDINSASIEISTNIKQFFDIKNANNIIINNLNLCNSIASAITVNDSNNISINNCNIYNISKTGVIIYNGTNNTVSNCKIYNIGAGGIIINAGDRKTLTSCNSIISNNHIFKFARLLKTYNPAIRMTGVGITSSNNIINNSSHNAIMFSGNDHIIEKNEIYDVAKETDDVGVIYTGRDWTFRGNIIRYNYIHDIDNNIKEHGAWGIYLDDCMCSAEIYENRFENVSGGILAGGGSGHIIKNNVFINCINSLKFDQRGLTYNLNQLNKNLASIPYESDIWKKKYPELIDFINGDPRIPSNNIITDNIYYNSGDFNIADKVIENGTVENNNKVITYPKK